MKKLTFKQYVESKERLRKAIAETPTCSSNYEVKRYCRISVGESKENKTVVSLKPRQKIIVEWSYQDINNPQPEVIIFDDISPNENEIYWTGSKLKQWLLKNTVEELF